MQRTTRSSFGRPTGALDEPRRQARSIAWRWSNASRKNNSMPPVEQPDAGTAEQNPNRGLRPSIVFAMDKSRRKWDHDQRLTVRAVRRDAQIHHRTRSYATARLQQRGRDR